MDVKSVIGAYGRTQDPTIVEDERLIMAFACLEAVKTWQYRPASLDGEPVPVFSTLTCRLE